jgi:hypothetical protein
VGPEECSVNAHSRISCPLLTLLVALTTMVMTSALADGMGEDRWGTYTYAVDEVDAAAQEAGLDLTLAPFRLSGKLNRNTPEFKRTHRLFDQVIDVAMRRQNLARKLDWAVYVHEGSIAECLFPSRRKDSYICQISGALWTE